MQASNSDRSVHLDAARALAALVVFTGHTRTYFLQFWRSALGLGQKPNQGDLMFVTSPSHEAVIVFFVLSGFLVGGTVMRSIQNAKWTWSRYLTARLIRLWVVLIPVLILTAIWDAIGKSVAPIDSLYWQIDADLAGDSHWLTFLGNIAFLQTILVRTFGSDGQLWSLANEFWYYMLFPMSMMVFVLRDRLLRLGAAVASVGIIFLVGRKIVIYFPIWLMGLAPYYMPRALPLRYFRVTFLASTLVLLSTLIILVKLHLNLFISDAITGFVFAMWCYVALHDPSDTSTSFPLYAWGATHLSRMSYTLYLVHVPLLMLLSGIIMGSWRPWPLDPTHISAVAAIWLFVLIASYGFYLIFERNTDAIRQYVTNFFNGIAHAR